MDSGELLAQGTRTLARSPSPPGLKLPLLPVPGEVSPGGCADGGKEQAGGDDPSPPRQTRPNQEVRRGAHGPGALPWGSELFAASIRSASI